MMYLWLTAVCTISLDRFNTRNLVNWPHGRGMALNSLKGYWSKGYVVAIRKLGSSQICCRTTHGNTDFPRVPSEFRV